MLLGGIVKLSDGAEPDGFIIRGSMIGVADINGPANAH